MTVEMMGEVLLFISRQRSSLNILQVYACNVCPAKTFKINFQSIEIQVLKCFMLYHTERSIQQLISNLNRGRGGKAGYQLKMSSAFYFALYFILNILCVLLLQFFQLRFTFKSRITYLVIF